MGRSAQRELLSGPITPISLESWCGPYVLSDKPRKDLGPLTKAVKEQKRSLDTVSAGLVHLLSMYLGPR